jgi:hypothetical protein
MKHILIEWVLPLSLAVGVAVYAYTPDKTAEITTVTEIPEPEPIAVIPIPEPAHTPLLCEDEITVLAKLVWGEARGCTTTEQAAVIWCVLNRVDSENPYYPDDVIGVATQPNQFVGYRECNPVEDELKILAEDVLTRWKSETQEGRVLPKEYVFFHGDGKHNYFRVNYRNDHNYYDWRLESPYVQ